MKYYNFILLLYKFIFVIGPLPNWNFNNQAIDLFDSSATEYSYTIYQSTYDSKTATLWKKITKNDGVIASNTNYLTIDPNSKGVTFEDVDSFYTSFLGANYLICPKGKFHPYKFDNETEVKSSDFYGEADWDLRCYRHDTNHFLLFYLKNGEHVFYSNNYKNHNNLQRFATVSHVYDYRLEQGNS